MRTTLPETTDEWGTLSDELRVLCAKGLMGVMSLVDPIGFRGRICSTDTCPEDVASPFPRGDQVRPTATAHAILAMSELGVEFIPNVRMPTDYISSFKALTSSGIRTDVGPVNRLPTYFDLLRHLLYSDSDAADDIAFIQATNKSSVPGPDANKTTWKKFAEKTNFKADDRVYWAARVLAKSSHSKTGKVELRESICISHVLHAIETTLPKVPEEELRAFRPILRDGCYWLIARLITILESEQERMCNLDMTGDDSHVLEIPAYAVLVASSGLRAAAALRPVFKPVSGSGETDLDFSYADAEVRKLRDLLGHWADRQLHRMMARRSIAGDAEFDVATLTYSLRARQLANARPLPHAFMVECLNQIAHSQLSNACWPDGVSNEAIGWDPSPQPSVEIALCLAAIPFSRDFLFTPSKDSVALALQALRPLLKFIDYLSQSYTIRTDPHDPKKQVIGWSSDRTRSRRRAEIWTTALAARTLHLAYLLTEGCARSKVIEDYDGTYPPQTQYANRSMAVDALFNDDFETDDITKPVRLVREQFLRPLIDQDARGNYFIETMDDASSFIIFGPPGSGKTFLLQSISKALGWPLIELNPGDFTKNGGERFEETASRIFKDLMSVFHAVVLFDECDELFRTRDNGGNEHRNLFSFVTASMLPKLQRLHDDGAILFVLATNYVHSIDSAVRRRGRFDRILLLDRPDKISRRKLISGWAHSPLSQPDIDKLVAQSAGYPFKDIRRLTEAHCGGAGTTEAPSDDSRSDYVLWWKTHGLSECQAASLQSVYPKIRERLLADIGELKPSDLPDIISLSPNGGH